MRIPLLIMVLVLTVSGFSEAADTSVGRVHKPVIKIEKGDVCVAPIEEIRRNHMKMLMHQRDATVRQGLRDPRFSLKNCVECHASRETGSVLGKDGFCSSCHTYTSVKIDCFECHTPLRQTRAAGVAR